MNFDLQLRSDSIHDLGHYHDHDRYSNDSFRSRNGLNDFVNDLSPNKVNGPYNSSKYSAKCHFLPISQRDKMVVESICI